MFVKHLGSPDELRTPPNTKVEVVKVGSSTVIRERSNPAGNGPNVSSRLSPQRVARCHTSTMSFPVRMKVAMDDGTSGEMGPGDAAEILPAHNA